MSILDKMYNSHDFTTSEQSVLQYILNQPHQMKEMNIRDLASVTYTSNTTIIRICKKLGYTGYKDFKLAFLMELQSQKFFNQNVNFNTPFYQSESTHQIINSMASLYRESVDLVSSSLDISTLENVVSSLLNHRRIFIFAIGDSRITCMNFINKLMKINIYPILSTENYEELAMAHNMTKEDCALFVSYTGSDQRFIDIAKRLYRKKIEIVTITANDESDLCKYSQHLIYIPNKEYQFKIATFYSQISFEFIASILYSLIYKKNYAKHHRHKDMIDSNGKK